MEQSSAHCYFTSATNFGVESKSRRVIPLTRPSNRALIRAVSSLSSRKNFPSRGSTKKVARRRLACIIRISALLPFQNVSSELYLRRPDKFVGRVTRS